MAQYKTGTVTVAFGSAQVIGSGTGWLGQVSPGDMLVVLYPGGLAGPAAFVAQVSGDTSLTLEQPWPGDGISGAAYGITRDFEPTTGAPLLARGDIGTDIVVNRAIARLAVQTASAVAGSDAVAAARGHADAAAQARSGAESARGTVQTLASQVAANASTAGTAATNAAQSLAGAQAAKGAAETAQQAAAGSAAQTAADRTGVAADKAAVATAKAAVDTALGQAGTGTATGLVYGSGLKSLVTVSDVVSVFAYDTRRGCDGGAWTEKCRGTSWYNETLNTATRGATRRFPVVALIVARATSLTIYDAHDLDAGGVPRMWKVFARTAANRGWPNITGVFACNGRLYVTSDTGVSGELYVYDFVRDDAYAHTASGRVQVLPSTLSAASLATAGTIGATQSSGAIVANRCNAVHARALPGAPLDSAGLPIPTVAVATTGGVSVIHPWGAVASLTGAGSMERVMLREGDVIAARNSVDDGRGVHYRAPIPYISAVWPTGALINAPTSAGVYPAYIIGTSGHKPQSVLTSTGWASGNNNGCTLVSEDSGDYRASMVAYAAINYATGWQPGDIRGAWLCDSTTGSIAGSAELVTNGDFSAGTTGWTASGGATIASVSGEMEVTSGGSVGPGAYQDIITTPGQAYSFRCIARRGSTNIPLALGVFPAGGSFISTEFSSASAVPLFLQFVATGTSARIFLYAAGTSTAGQTAYFDNVSVRVALPDRSYKSKGLVVTGTLTRTALPCGLAVVGGFSAANYLEQAYNPDLDFTGDFSCGFWTANPFGGGVFFDRLGADRRIAAYVSNGKLGVSLIGSAGAVYPSTSSTINDGNWHHALLLRRGNRVELWLDGALEAAVDGSGIGSLSAPTALRVGLSGAGDTPLPTAARMALLRISATAPSPAQIRKIYEDERPLFQAGQPALLGGTSNNVTALSANPETGTLAVGTGDGVSVFAGLSRIAYHDGANTAGAVGSDSITSLSSVGPHLLVGTAANAGLMTEARIGRDLMRPGTPALPPPAPQAVTVDATPTDLSPRLYVGEGEVRTVRSLITARQYGGTAGQVAAYELRYLVRRDAGGVLALVGAANVTVIHETSAGMDAAVSVDTAAQTVTERVTGLAGTRLVWTVDRQVQALTMGDNYAAQ